MGYHKIVEISKQPLTFEWFYINFHMLYLYKTIYQSIPFFECIVYRFHLFLESKLKNYKIIYYITHFSLVQSYVFVGILNVLIDLIQFSFLIFFITTKNDIIIIN